MALNPFYANIFIDSCAFDPKYQPESSCAEEIFRRYENDDINIVIAHSNIKESEHPNTPTKVKKEALTKIFTIETNLIPEERQRKQDIWNILTGNGKPENMEQDANHVFEAHKYGGYFVTTDVRIINKRGDLHGICNAIIVKPCELLALIKEFENS